MEKQNEESFEIVTRHIVMDRDLNAHGNLFGGIMLAWLDEASALFVMEKIGYTNFVTVNMQDVSFKSPGNRGDAIVLYSRVLETGRSSITVQSRALAHDPEKDIKREVINCRVTFVCLKDGKPFPYFESEQYRTYCSRSDLSSNSSGDKKSSR